MRRLRTRDQRLDNFEMVLEADKGNVKAMYVIGEETAISDSHASTTQEAMTGLEFFVVAS